MELTVQLIKRITLLIGLTASLFSAAVFAEEEIAARIAPVGDVYLDGEIATASTANESSEPAGPRSGEKIYNNQTTMFRYFDIVSLKTKLTYDDVNSPKYIQFSVMLELSNNQSVVLNLRNQLLTGDYSSIGLITAKDYQKAESKPHACKDEFGRLRVGAAVGVGAGQQSGASETADPCQRSKADGGLRRYNKSRHVHILRTSRGRSRGGPWNRMVLSAGYYSMRRT